MPNRLAVIAVAFVVAFAVRARAQEGQPDAVTAGAVELPPGPVPRNGVSSEQELAARTRVADNANAPLPQGVQFDPRGWSFGPWVRRCVAQVERNWMERMPPETMSLRGPTAVTFVVYKDGSINDVKLAARRQVEGFNNAALVAMKRSNPPCHCLLSTRMNRLKSR